MVYDAGSAVLQIVPGLAGLEQAVRKQVTAWGTGWGKAAGKEFDKGFREEVGDRTGKAPVGPPPARSKRQGQESGGAFADGFKRRVEQALKQLPKVTIGVARNEAEQELKDLAAQMRALADKRIGVDVDATAALAEAQRIQQRLDELGRSSPDVQVRADTAAASAQLAAITAQVQRLGRSEANVRVDVDGGAASAQLAAIRSSASASALGLQALIGAGALLGPVLVPAAAAATAAVAAIGPAALAGAAGIGVAVLGFVGVAEAVQQMGAAEEQAAQSAATLAGRQAALASAADGVRSAERSLANTRASVAGGARRAAQQVADAQRNLTSAERDALAVRRELSRAQEEARRALEDLASQVRSNALDQQQANLDVAEARAELDRVRSDPSATAAERQQAEITYQRQVLQVEDLRRRGERLAQDQAAANRAGVNGSEQVRAVRERIAAADERVAESQRALSEARRAQAEQERQAAFQVAQAQQALVSSQRALAQASIQAGLGGTAAMIKLRQSMAALSPEGRTFARFLFGLRDEFLGLRRAAERGLLPGVQAGIQALLPYLPQIRTFIERIGGAMGTLAQRAGEALASPFWARFFDWLGRSAGPMLDDFGRIIGNLAEGFAALLMAFAPISEEILAGLGELTAGFADWAKGLSGSSGFREFVDYIRANGPTLVALLGDFTIVALKLLVALAPLGQIVLEGLGGLFDWLAKLDPGVLLYIAGAVAAVVGGVVALAAGPVAAIGVFIAAVVAMAGAVVYAYNRVSWFRTVVDTVFGAVAAAATWLWRHVLVPAFEGISAAISFAWHRVIQPVFAALSWFTAHVIGPAVTRLWRNVIAPAWAGIRLAIQVAWAAIRVVFGAVEIYVRAVLAPLFTWLYDKVIKPVWGGIGLQIRAVWNTVIKPVLSALGGYITDHVVPAFRAGVTAVGRAWDRIRDVAKAPVRFVVETIINKGIIDNYNKIAKAFGVQTVDPVPLPKGFARGGVLPGYTPGRDVHRFFGPGGMALDLSGGEAILRPEVTRALGPAWVDAVNAAARRAGAAGVRRVLGFADGGIFSAARGLFKSAREKATDVITGAKDLITDPGGVLRRLARKLVGTLPGRGTAFGHLLTAIPVHLADVMAGKIEGFFGADPGRAAGKVPAGSSPFGGATGMMRALRAAFPGLTLISGFRPGARTLSGNLSYHARDRAVDLPPRRDVAAYIHGTWRRVTKELITPFPEYNLLNGKPHRYTGAVWAQHNWAGGNAHDHWAAARGGILPPVGTYDSGGLLPPGVTTVINGTGRPEPVLTSQQFADLAAHRAGGMDLRVIVQDGAVAGLVRVEVDNQFGALADARIYNTAG